MQKLCLIVVMHCLCQGAYSQELSIELPTETSLVLFNSARMAVHSTQFEKAEDLLRTVIENEPDFAMAHAYLAVVDMFLYRDPEAATSAARYPENSPSSGEQQMSEILVRFANGVDDVAVVLLWEFLRSYPDDRYARHLFGMIQTDLGEGEEAIETLRELIRNYPDYDPAWNHLSNAFLETGQSDRAKAAAEMFLELSPDNPSAYDALAEVLAREGETERAVVLLRRAVEMEPRMAFAWMHMGDILAGAGLVEEAESAYENGFESSVLYGDDFRVEISERLAELTDVWETQEIQEIQEIPEALETPEIPKIPEN